MTLQRVIVNRLHSFMGSRLLLYKRDKTTSASNVWIGIGKWTKVNLLDADFCLTEQTKIGSNSASKRNQYVDWRGLLTSSSEWTILILGLRPYPTLVIVN